MVSKWRVVIYSTKLKTIIKDKNKNKNFSSVRLVNSKKIF